MSELLRSIPRAELEDFHHYCSGWFDHQLSPEEFVQFKRLVRSAYRTWDSWDSLDYEAVKCLAHPAVDHIEKVALVCYNHNETYFREQVLDWLSVTLHGLGIKDASWFFNDHLFTRKRHYPRC